MLPILQRPLPDTIPQQKIPLDTKLKQEQELVNWSNNLQIEEDVPTNIVDYILSDIFHQVKPCTKTYGEHQDKIYKYIKLENVRAEYQALLQVDLGGWSSIIAQTQSH